MEKHLQIQQNQSLLLSDKEVKIGEVLWHVNMLTSYPVSDTMLTHWCKTINRLMPGIQIEGLERMMELMLRGRIEWDHKSGIQNIFKGYEKINSFDTHNRPLNY